MYLIYVKIIFSIIAILLALLLALRVIFESKFKNNNKLSPIIAFIGALFLLYTLTGIILCIIYPSLLTKLILLMFAISPFIIGRLVNYKSLKFYSIIQIICVILSIGFVVIF